MKPAAFRALLATMIGAPNDVTLAPTLKRASNHHPPVKDCAPPPIILGNEGTTGGEMRPKILICDDEDVLRALVRASLDRGEYELVEARDGDEAVEIAMSQHPSLVLLDMMMPGCSGVEVLERLRADPALADTPVIMLTARTQENDRAAAKDAGATVFLPKPFSPSELARLVDETLRVAS